MPECGGGRFRRPEPGRPTVRRGAERHSTRPERGGEELFRARDAGGRVTRLRLLHAQYAELQPRGEREWSQRVSGRRAPFSSRPTSRSRPSSRRPGARDLLDGCDETPLTVSRSGRGLCPCVRLKRPVWSVERQGRGCELPVALAADCVPGGSARGRGLSRSRSAAGCATTLSASPTWKCSRRSPAARPRAATCRRSSRCWRSRLCAAVARPERNTMVPEERATVILVIDDSLSMQARDVEPTRARSAASALRTFLGRAPDRLKVGLIVFSGEAARRAAHDRPRDRAGFHRRDRRLHRVRRDGDRRRAEGGGRAGRAGGARARARRRRPRADDRLLRSGRSAEGANKLVSILFLSDGSQTRGRLQPLEGAQLAADAGIPVYTIALGTPEGVLRGDFGGPGIDPNAPGGTASPGFGEREIPVPPDPETLGEIARMTGGEFSEAKDSKTA